MIGDIMQIDKDNIIGLTEKVTLIGNQNNYKTITARIDTGAVISSIDVKMAADLALGPVLRMKKVKNANGMAERAVVKCSFKIKGKIYKTDVTIADRKNLKYKALIGQNLLKKTAFYIYPKRH